MMNGKQNVLITTLGYTESLSRANIYKMKDSLGFSRYCAGISPAEAGTKYILSKYDIDKIIILGPEEDEKTVRIAVSEMPAVIDDRSLSEFDFYCYRIGQFINNTDIEAADIVFTEDYDTVRASFDELRKQMGCSATHLLDNIAGDEANQAAFDSFCESRNLTGEQIATLKYEMFIQSDSFSRMHPLKANMDVMAYYYPVKKDDGDRVLGDTLFRIYHSLDSDADTNIFLDLQGMSSAEGNILWNLFEMTGINNARQTIREVIRSEYARMDFCNDIVNESSQYDIELLLSGMRTFVNYGKVNLIEKYVEKCEIDSPLIRRLIAAMKYVDMGVALNNIADIRYGVQAIKMLLDTTEIGKLSSNDMVVFSILKNGITEDYGTMLTDEELDICDLIEWAAGKQFYQQALTMIESWIPSDMVGRGLYFYAASKEDAEDYLERINLLYWNEIPKNRYVFNNPDHFFIKTYGRSVINNRQSRDGVVRDMASLKVRQLHEPVPEMCKAYSNLGDDELLYEVLTSYLNIGNVRNAVSHAMNVEHAITGIEDLRENKNAAELLEALNKFLRIYRTARGKLATSPAENQAEPVLVDGDEVRAYTNKHKMVPLTNIGPDFTIENSVQCDYNGQIINVSVRMLKPEESLETETEEEKRKE